jgi:hypothetical protein
VIEILLTVYLSKGVIAVTAAQEIALPALLA